MNREQLDRFYVELTSDDEMGIKDSRIDVVFNLAKKALAAPEAAAWQDCTRCGAAILNKHPSSEPQGGE